MDGTRDGSRSHARSYEEAMRFRTMVYLSTYHTIYTVGGRRPPSSRGGGDMGGEAVNEG
jgi:hypothetical protein